MISRLAFCVDASAADHAIASSGQTLIWIFPMNGVFIGGMKYSLVQLYREGCEIRSMVIFPHRLGAVFRKL